MIEIIVYRVHKNTDKPDAFDFRVDSDTDHLDFCDWPVNRAFAISDAEQLQKKTAEQQEKINLLLSACKEALGFVELIEVSPYVSVFLGNKLRTAIAKAEGQG